MVDKARNFKIASDLKNLRNLRKARNLKRVKKLEKQGLARKFQNVSLTGLFS